MHAAIKYAEQICYSSKEVLHFTYEMAKKYADKPGIYMECGVAAGAQIIAMAAAAPDKTIYALDSFQGIPLPSNKDNQMPGIKFLSEVEQKALPNPGEQALISSGATSVSQDDFWSNIRTSGVNGMNIYAFEGWFEEMLPRFSKEMELSPPEEISILRLDGDLYNSTYVCLKYLYPKVIKGGLVIIDDYALPGCRAAVLNYFGMSVPDIKLMHSAESTIAYWERNHASRSIK